MQPLRSWHGQRPSFQGGLDPSVAVGVGGVCYAYGPASDFILVRQLVIVVGLHLKCVLSVFSNIFSTPGEVIIPNYSFF